MSLIITAFGQSPTLSLKQRTEAIIDMHSKAADIVDQYAYKLYNKKVVQVDIRDREGTYQHIYENVKKGLNAKVVKPIRYKENDIADISSRCGLHPITNGAGLNFEYVIGYTIEYCLFPPLAIHVSGFNDEAFFTKQRLFDLSKLYIETWDPYMLCVTDYYFFNKYSKSFEKNVPRSGWFTYLSYRFLQKQPNKNNLVSCLSDPLIPLAQKQRAVTGFTLENLNEYGIVFWTTNEHFNGRNAEHVSLGLKLEDFFIENNIQMTFF